MQTRVIHGSRWKPLLMAVGGLLLIWLAVWAIETKAPDWGVWLYGAFGVVLAAVGAIWTLRPSTLTLTDEGFEVRDAVGRRFSARWSWIASLELWHNPAARQALVAWRLRPGAPRTTLGRIDLNLFEIDGALPGLWSMGPQELLETMQTWHSAATARDEGNTPA
ncbi:MAG: hypothetical protein ACT6RD_01245 [Brevundimonas sp.]|uniref:hypothetical protein n=1 Tax=Brevundimonas sp. TaxID=1871086 RepID=UPI0040344A56